MNENNNKGGNRAGNEGFNPNKRGYKPPGSNLVIGGRTPEKSQQKPVNPPKKK